MGLLKNGPNIKWHMCPSQENQSLGRPTRSNTNQTVLQQNIVKFWIHVVDRIIL